MKRLLQGLFVLAVMAGVAKAADYTVTLTTYVPTGSAAEFSAGSYPNISGGASLRLIVLANAGATAQDVSIYDTCTSSTAATLAGTISLPGAIGTTVIEVPWRTYKLTSPCFNKSATGSVVKATLLYE